MIKGGIISSNNEMRKALKAHMDRLSDTTNDTYNSAFRTFFYELYLNELLNKFVFLTVKWTNKNDSLLNIVDVNNDLVLDGSVSFGSNGFYLTVVGTGGLITEQNTSYYDFNLRDDFTHGLYLSNSFSTDGYLLDVDYQNQDYGHQLGYPGVTPPRGTISGSGATFSSITVPAYLGNTSLRYKESVSYNMKLNSYPGDQTLSYAGSSTVTNTNDPPVTFTGFTSTAGYDYDNASFYSSAQYYGYYLDDTEYALFESLLVAYLDAIGVTTYE